MRSLVLAAALSLTGAGVAVLPQLKNAGGANVPSVGAVLVDTSGQPFDASHPLPSLAMPVQEALALAVNNVPAAPITAFGGSYILSQLCTGYGSLALQVLGADGMTWQTVTNVTAADTTGGTALALGSSAQVRAVLTGTTGCAATLSRVPA